jgi:predicted DNA-binding transcriptional regulator
MSHDGAEHLLSLPRDVIAAGLADMRISEHPWEADMSAREALARLMTVHLYSSFATRVRHETGWCSYDGGCFNPLPPWGAPRR